MAGSPYICVYQGITEYFLFSTPESKKEGGGLFLTCFYRAGPLSRWGSPKIRIAILEYLCLRDQGIKASSKFSDLGGDKVPLRDKTIFSRPSKLEAIKNSSSLFGCGLFHSQARSWTFFLQYGTANEPDTSSLQGEEEI